MYPFNHPFFGPLWLSGVAFIALFALAFLMAELSVRAKWSGSPTFKKWRWPLFAMCLALVPTALYLPLYLFMPLP